MTRKDYELIASYFALNRKDFVPGEDGFSLLSILSEQLAYEFAKDNPRFDRERFLKACGTPRF